MILTSSQTPPVIQKGGGGAEKGSSVASVSDSEPEVELIDDAVPVANAEGHVCGLSQWAICTSADAPLCGPMPVPRSSCPATI